jgi:hypothetical protein
MSNAQALVDNLASIGATIELTENRLLLRAGRIAVPASLVTRIRDAKPDLIAALAAAKAAGAYRPENDGRCEQEQASQEAGGRTYTGRPPENLLIQWLNEHPVLSPPGFCAWCGTPELPSAMVVPFGIMPSTHTWLHPECWSAWHRARLLEAEAALAKGHTGSGGQLDF